MATTTHKSFKCFKYYPIVKNSKNKEVKKSNKKNKWSNIILIGLIHLGFLGFFCTTSVFAAESKDLLSSALPDIKANFGLKSVFIKALYLMEIYYGWRKYRESNNPFAVGSIVLVVLALTYAIDEWVFN